PTVSSTTLPGQAATSSAIFDRFSVTFSEDMAAATVNNSANYDLRSAGTDGLFNTADDAVYHVSTAPAFTTGQSASFSITDGPLQAGYYQLTISGVTDRAGNVLNPTYVLNFTISNVAPFVLESRSDDTFATATSLGSTGMGSAGSFTVGTAFAAGNTAF